MNGEVFSIVVERRSDKVIIVGLDSWGATYSVSAEIYEIGLGDFCFIEVFDGEIIQIQKCFATFGDDITIEVVDDEIVVSNVLGEFKKIDDVFFDTTNFGKVAYLGDRSSLSEMMEDGTLCKINLKLLDENKTERFPNCKWSASIQNFCEEEKIYKIPGLIVGEIDTEQKYVWTKDTFSGLDGVVVVSEEQRNLPIGTWIEMLFDPIEYNSYFLTNPEKVPLVARRFNIINPVLRTKVGKTKVEVHLDIVKIETSHEAGDDIHNSVLGLISDPLELMRKGPGTYTIVVERMEPKPGKSGRIAVWKVLRVVIIHDLRGHFSRQLCLWKPAKESFSVINRKEVEMFSKLAIVLSVEPNHFAKGGYTYFIWLLKDHIKSIYHAENKLLKLDVGHIFEGKFYKTDNDSKFFECHSYVHSIDGGQDMVCSFNFDNQLEVEVEVNCNYNDEKLKISNDYIGEIIDIHGLLRSEGSRKIYTTFRQVNWKMTWIVERIIDDTEQDLIDSFCEVWKIPLMREAIEGSGCDPTEIMNKYYGLKSSGY